MLIPYSGSIIYGFSQQLGITLNTKISKDSDTEKRKERFFPLEEESHPNVSFCVPFIQFSYFGPVSLPCLMLRAGNDAHNDRKNIFTHSTRNQWRAALIRELLDCRKLFLKWRQLLMRRWVDKCDVSFERH